MRGNGCDYEGCTLLVERTGETIPACGQDHEIMDELISNFNKHQSERHAARIRRKK